MAAQRGNLFKMILQVLIKEKGIRYNINMRYEDLEKFIRTFDHLKVEETNEGFKFKNKRKTFISLVEVDKKKLFWYKYLTRRRDFAWKQEFSLDEIYTIRMDTDFMVLYLRNHPKFTITF